VAREPEHQIEREPGEPVRAGERERFTGTRGVVDAPEQGQFVRMETLGAEREPIHPGRAPRLEQRGSHRLGIGLERDLGVRGDGEP
jgi:hypothetical protein